MTKRPALLLFLLAAPASAKPATPAEAKQFVLRVNDQLKSLTLRQATAEWIAATYITDDTERNDAWANEALFAATASAIKDSARYTKLKLDPETARMLYLLRALPVYTGDGLIAPSDGKLRQELADLKSSMAGHYGKAKYCKGGTCRDLQQLSNLMATSRDEAALRDAYQGWHATAREERPKFARFVELVNQGAKEVGFADTGELWRSAYDMPPDAFEKETERLWQQVRPLYQQLHCYVRGKLAKSYPGKVDAKGPIPAHLLGNMWAQEWGNIYPLVEPYAGQSSLDVTAALKKKGYDEVKMMKLGESFFTSLGLDPLPASFWERSMIKKPRDRDVVCHASAWDVMMNNDLRIKMCVEVKEEDLITIHHELGHDYYFHYYDNLPFLYQNGANDGFHEAIGDALTLSITPSYLKKLGLIEQVPNDEKGLINFQMKHALDKVAFLPFGLLIDRFRWGVFSGKIAPARYDAAWWELRTKYQGLSAPVARSDGDFDPGAKYHVAANVPYMRYFLARLLQFQFHRALCRAAGHKGPLHECSVYGNAAAGEKLRAMLKLGASKPWPEALEAMTGEKQMDASALLEYFAPLAGWLEKQNAGQACGW